MSGPAPIGEEPPPPDWDRPPPSTFTLERVFLALAAIGLVLYALVFLLGAFAFMPYGLLGLVVLGFGVFVVHRVVRDHLGSAEDRYYEENFDR